MLKFSKKWQKSKRIVVCIVIVIFLHHIHSFFILGPSSTPSDNNNRSELGNHRSDSENIYSLCSAKSDKRGLNQNVISYSLYGPFIFSPRHFTRYVSRLKENAERIKEIYKGQSLHT